MWQPIETAPRDGTPVMLGRAESDEYKGVSTIGWWQEAWPDSVDDMGQDAGFVDYLHSYFMPGRSFGNPDYQYSPRQPTHWMPIPTPPETNN